MGILNWLVISRMWRVRWLLVLDLHITHERSGRRSDPSIDGHLRYPNDVDRSLNETVTDKIRKYRDDYNNNPPTTISFIPDIASTSGRLHSGFVFLLFLQARRETDRFFAASGVQLVKHHRDQFHYHCVTFSSQLKFKILSILAKTAALRIILNICGVQITHSPIILVNLLLINLVSIFRCSSLPCHPVYVSRVDPSTLAFSRSSHRHSYISLLFRFRFID